MTENRSFNEIMAAHQGPWEARVLPGARNGMALIEMFDKAGVVVPLMTILRIATLASGAAAAQQAKAAA